MSNYPKIGIRPVIDGRQGGVRESLEEKTMNLARIVSELISNNLKNGDGTPVECVIADGTIGRVGESAACAEKFERAGVGATITVTSCWCYGTGTMDMNSYHPKRNQILERMLCTCTYPKECQNNQSLMVNNQKK